VEIVTTIAVSGPPQHIGFKADLRMHLRQCVVLGMLHVRRSRVRIIDKSGLALASQNAIALQYVVEGGCLRILPLLEEVRGAGVAWSPGPRGVRAR